MNGCLKRAIRYGLLFALVMPFIILLFLLPIHLISVIKAGILSQFVWDTIFRNTFEIYQLFWWPALLTGIVCGACYKSPVLPLITCAAGGLFTFLSVIVLEEWSGMVFLAAFCFSIGGAAVGLIIGLYLDWLRSRRISFPVLKNSSKDI